MGEDEIIYDESGFGSGAGIREIGPSMPPLLILASGEAKRMGALGEKHNKGMLPLQGKPILEHIVEHFGKAGVTRIIFAVGSKKEEVISYFSDSKSYPFGKVKFYYASGSCSVGTAGELAKAKNLLEKEPYFFLHYGDALTNIDVSAFFKEFIKSGRTIATPAMEEIPTEVGVYVVDRKGNPISFHEKPFINDISDTRRAYSNVPIYAMTNKIWENKNIFVPLNPAENLMPDFNHDVMPDFVKAKQVSLYHQKGLWHIDVGDTKKYEEAKVAYLYGIQHKLRKRG